MLSPKIKAAARVVLIFSVVGPPVGLAVSDPRFLLIFPVSYVVAPLAALAGVVFFLVLKKLVDQKIWPSIIDPGYERGLGAVLGAGCSGLTWAGYSLVMLLMQGDLQDFHELGQQGGQVKFLLRACFAAGSVCGLIAAPSVVRSLRSEPPATRPRVQLRNIFSLLIGVAFIGILVLLFGGPPIPNRPLSSSVKVGDIISARMDSFRSNRLHLHEARRFLTVSLDGVSCPDETDPGHLTVLRYVNEQVYEKGRFSKLLRVEIRHTSLRDPTAEVFLPDGRSLNQELVRQRICPEK